MDLEVLSVTTKQPTARLYQAPEISRDPIAVSVSAIVVEIFRVKISPKAYAISTLEFEFPGLSDLEKLSNSVCKKLDSPVPILILISFLDRFSG